MRRLALLVIVFLLSLSPAALGQESALPPCTDKEFVEFFNLIVAHQLQFDGDITNAGMFQRASRAHMERREIYQSAPPRCSDAIAIQRLLTQLGGDTLARAALDLADIPADDNPYRQRLPDDQTRIERLLSTMLGIDRSDAPSAEQRVLPACRRDDWALLDDTVAALLDIPNLTPDETDPTTAIATIDQLLLWREAYIPLLPACAESIELIQALSAAATDSAAYHAFTYGGVSLQRNPFPPLLEAAIATLASWQEQIPPRTVGPAATASTRSFTENRLPSCAQAPFADDLNDLETEYIALLERANEADSRADLVDYGLAQIAFIEMRLAALPPCQEAFDLRWWASESLADAALRSAIETGAPASIAAPHDQPMAHNIKRASSAWDQLKSALGRLDAAPSASDVNKSIAPAAVAAPECSDPDLIFLLAYVTPVFWELSDAALKVSQPDEVDAFINRAFAFRRLLWTYLPRCEDALAMGLLMRSVAADYVAMLALEMAGAPINDIAYLPKIADDIDQLFLRINRFNVTCGSINGTAKTYYVVAENIANIRSCASTNCAILTTAHRGQRLDVVDDLSNWYEIVLPSCETAFIAGFLASQTPPPR